MDYDYYMQFAIKEAKNAEQIGEVPIGCIIVYDNKIIATGYNKRNTKKNSLAHAEIEAINTACEYLGDWRLEGCTIFVTLEPCAMCAGAILQARIDRLVYGASNKKGGSVMSIVNILDNNQYNHTVDIVISVLEKECSAMITDFFLGLRKKRRNKIYIEEI